jgi:hypothetical protein
MRSLKTTLKSLTKNKEVLTTATTSNSNSSASSTLNFKSNNGELKGTISINNTQYNSLEFGKSFKKFSPTEVQIFPQWEYYLPAPEEPTKIENLTWSNYHENAFKELTSLTSKMDLSTKNMDKLSYLLNTKDEFLIKDLFETNRELLFNGGELANLLLEISVNVPMQDFSTYLTEVNGC